MDKNSMTYWYPLIKSLPIPQPRTEIVKLNAGYFEIMAVIEPDGNIDAIEAQMDEIQEACKEVGIPLFLRTSHTSGKHSWKETCFLTDLSKIRRHISALIEDTAMKEIPIDALVLRKYIEMDSTFTAFSGKMPVNSERRYFINNGKVQCHHSYWIPKAISSADEAYAVIGKSNLVSNWRELLVELNAESNSEIERLTGWAELVAMKLKGYWSVDFCRAKNGTWYLIDCAQGERSWHPKCQYAKEERW